jgi:hypothetical protein
MYGVKITRKTTGLVMVQMPPIYSTKEDAITFIRLVACQLDQETIDKYIYEVETPFTEEDPYDGFDMPEIEPTVTCTLHK